MYELTRLGVRMGSRGLGFRVLLLTTLVLLGMAFLAGNFSGRQQLTVALDVAFSGMRIVLMLMVLVWVQDLLARDIERKSVYFMLAYPVARWQFLLSRFIAVAVLSGMSLLFIGTVFCVLLYLFGSSYAQMRSPALDWSYWLVLVGMWLDLLVVAAFALLLATLSTTPFLPFLLGLAFALAARGMGPTIDYLRGERSDPLHERLFSPLLDHAYVWLPDLSRLDWRVLSLYDLPPEPLAMVLAALNALAYIIALTGLATLVFQRRNLT
jgi:Cu-processing system permease protein